jgi:YHS domain-containing protein
LGKISVRSREKELKVTDPVYKIVIEDKDAVGTSKYKGATYYFCTGSCKERFDKDPEAYLKEKVEVKVEKEKLKTKKTEIESLDAEIRKQFKETEEKIKDLSRYDRDMPDVIKQRHRDFVRK